VAAPRVGVGGPRDNAMRIGPVVIQTLPDATGALRDVGVMGALGVDLELTVGAVAEQLRTARPEVGEAGDVLLRRRRGRLLEMDGRHTRQTGGSAGASRPCRPWSTLPRVVVRLALIHVRRPWACVRRPDQRAGRARWTAGDGSRWREP